MDKEQLSKRLKTDRPVLQTGGISTNPVVNDLGLRLSLNNQILRINPKSNHGVFHCILITSRGCCHLRHLSLRHLQNLHRRSLLHRSPRHLFRAEAC